MYLHPWEIDPDQPRMEGSVISKLRHYLNLERTEERLKNLLHDFSFAPVTDAIQPIRDMCQARVQGGAAACAAFGQTVMVNDEVLVCGKNEASL
jgi:hypothetical protein